MFKPTIENLYHLMKDRAVKPSMYHKILRSSRINLSERLMFWSILNDQKDFEIQQFSNSMYMLKLSHYTYSVMNPIGEIRQCNFKINKYDSKNSNKFMPFQNYA